MAESHTKWCAGLQSKVVHFKVQKANNRIFNGNNVKRQNHAIVDEGVGQESYSTDRSDRKRHKHDDEHDETRDEKTCENRGRMIPPNIECFSEVTYRNKECMFLSKMTQLSDILKSKHFCQSTTFLNEALLRFNPQKSADPFYMFGIDLYCVVDPKDIYKMENVKEDSMDVILDETASNVLEYMKELAQRHEDPNKNVLACILSGMLEEIHVDVSSGNDNGCMEVFETNESSKQPTLTELWDFLNIFLDYGTDMKKTQLRIDNLEENQLKELVRILLKLDGKCFHTGSLIMQQFEVIIGDTCKVSEQQYTPDLVYTITTFTYKVPIKFVSEENIGPTTGPTCTCITSHSEVPQREDLESPVEPIKKSCNWLKVSVDSCLLWQVFEQMFGILMDTWHDVTNRKVVFQAGLVIVNCKVRIMVLAMNANVYKTLYKRKRAIDTVSLLLKYAHSQEMWCRYYIDSREYSVCDVVHLAKYSCVNFCIAI